MPDVALCERHEGMFGHLRGRADIPGLIRAGMIYDGNKFHKDEE